MAITPSIVSALPAMTHIPGDLRESIVTLTIGAADTYATDGFAVTAANFGLNSIVDIAPSVTSAGYWTTYVPATASTGKIKVWTAGSGAAAPAELGNASAALQSKTLVLRVLGR